MTPSQLLTFKFVLTALVLLAPMESFSARPPEVRTMDINRVIDRALSPQTRCTDTTKSREIPFIQMADVLSVEVNPQYCVRYDSRQQCVNRQVCRTVCSGAAAGAGAAAGSVTGGAAAWATAAAIAASGQVCSELCDNVPECTNVSYCAEWNN